MLLSISFTTFWNFLEEKHEDRDVGHAEPHLSVASFVRFLFPNDDNSIQIPYEGSSTDSLLQAGLDEDDE